MILFICIFILLYGLIQYDKGHKGQGAFIYIFFLTEGFHFLSKDWCPVKYTDFATIYLAYAALKNAFNGNTAFFKPQVKIYKVATIIGLYITLEFVRTIIMSEEIISFALANYRTYIPIFSFLLAQELKERDVIRLFKQIAFITILSTVLFDLQPILHVKFLQHASIDDVNESGYIRYRNIPYLTYFFMIYSAICKDFNRWKTTTLILVFLIAIVLTQHRAVMMTYVFCIGIYLLMSSHGGKIFQYCIIGLFFLLLAGDAIFSRFKEIPPGRSTIEDIYTVFSTDYTALKAEDFVNEEGTLTFRVMLLMERVQYINQLDYFHFAFGLGTIHEDSPRTQRQFNFNIGSYRSSNNTIGQTSSGDLAWVNPLMRFGFLGIGLLLFLSWSIIVFFYKNRNISDIAMSAFLFYLFLILNSFKNDHLYGSMQLFFIYLLISSIRYSNLKTENNSST